MRRKSGDRSDVKPADSRQIFVTWCVPQGNGSILNRQNCAAFMRAQ